VGQRDLCRRDVDAYDTGHLRKRRRHRHAGAAPDIEHTRDVAAPFYAALGFVVWTHMLVRDRG